MKRATIINIVIRLEQDFNKAWRDYRKAFGRSDSHFRWVSLE